MGQYYFVLCLVIIGLALLWFGYTLFFGPGMPAWGYGTSRKRKNIRGISYPGAPQTCPVCCVKLNEGELVKSLAFPSLTGGKDRFMHIKGCLYCLSGEQSRVCPVCGNFLQENDILVCRLFERPRRPHVHFLGCTRCKGL